MTTAFMDHCEGRFDPMMLESQWREELMARMARGAPLNMEYETEFDELAFQILPPAIVRRIRCDDNPQRRRTEIVGTLLSMLCIQILADGTTAQRSDALKTLEAVTPLDPQDPLFVIVLDRLVRFSVDRNVPSALRQRSTEIVNNLSN